MQKRLPVYRSIRHKASDPIWKEADGAQPGNHARRLRSKLVEPIPEFKYTTACIPYCVAIDSINM